MAGWGYNRDGVILFQFQFLTEVVLVFSSSEVIFKSGVAFKRIRYLLQKITSCKFSENMAKNFRYL